MKYLIVGLGNPGEKYKFTRHNIGHLVLDKLCSKLDVISHLEKNIGFFWEAYVYEHTFYLFKPLCFMNESGAYVAKALNKLNMSLDNLVVVHDDKDIPFGNIRFKFGGSSAGHRGVQSIINVIGKDFLRLRCGIGASYIENTAEFVLNNFMGDERKILNEFLEYAADAILYYTAEGLSNAMNCYNRKASKT
jgi:PTH1 family peptidyl-tRNA hydrolase